MSRFVRAPVRCAHSFAPQGRGQLPFYRALFTASADLHSFATLITQT